MPGTQETQGQHGRQRIALHENHVGQLLRNGEYLIEAVLGQGGMGRVFLASHTALQLPVAIKQGVIDQPIPEIVIAELDHILYSENAAYRTSTNKPTEQDFPLSGGTQTDRVLHEALLLARLKHPSLPVLYDYFVEAGSCYLVMDYIPGPTLSAYIDEHAPLPPLEALNYAMQLCDVLEYLHKQSPPVIFRDLKPSNIILAPDGRVMLVDFGIARYFKAGQMNDTADFGSPGYASPEQYKGEAQTDGRSDLYSLGIILHEMISGQRPAGMGKKLPTLHTINPAFSAVLSGLVTIATQSEPRHRFQSARAFYLALERAYTIEERREYRQNILAAEANKAPHEPSWQTLASLQERNAQEVFLPGEYITQRQKMREALQEAHREYLEQAQAEMHLTSIDESLRHRSSVGLASLSLHAVDDVEEEEEELALPPRSSFIARRIGRTIFGLALAALVAIASLNIHSLLSHHPGAVLQKRHTQVTPTPVRTAKATTLNGIWQVLPSLPSPEADNAAIYVQVEGRAYIYMSGGFRGPQLLPRYDDSLYRYDIAAAHWEVLANHNFPGMVNNAVALDKQNRLFFTAGYSSNLYVVNSLLYMYQPATGMVKKIVPPSQVSIGFGAAMVADQHGYLYITQGFMSAGNPRTLAGTGWYRYDIANDRWDNLAPLPIGLGYVVLAPDDTGGIFLLGGSMDAGQSLPTKQVYHYDIASNTWTTEQTSSPALLSGASSCLNGPEQLVIVGGYNPATNKTSGQTWLVNLHTLHWASLAPLPSGGSLLGTAACDGKGHVYLTRGANDPSRPTPDLLELTLSS